MEVIAPGAQDENFTDKKSIPSAFISSEFCPCTKLYFSWLRMKQGIDDI